MIEGLLIWAHSYCRSTLAFYEGLGTAFVVPIRLLFWQKGFANRSVIGHSNDEFKHLDMRFIGDDFSVAQEEFRRHQKWHQFFGTYQEGGVFRKMLLKAGQAGCRVAIASEAPCNMNPFPRHMAKEVFIKAVLKHKISKHLKTADFILNLSGNQVHNLKRIGWPDHKIVPCGYYSPPLLGSQFIPRTVTHWHNFKVLMTGRHEWHRDPMVLLEALHILSKHGIHCKTIITQDGPLLPQMKRYSQSHGLDVDFPGFVSYKKLIDLYQKCSCFVATGRAEPWGLRVNDALQCGAPIVISSGMGAVKLVNDYACGLSFPQGNADALADNLALLIEDKERYCKLAQSAFVAAKACHPIAKAAEIVDVIKSRFSGW